MMPTPIVIAQRLGRDLAAIAADALADASGASVARPAPALMPTPRDVIAREGTASLYRFVGAGPRRGKPILLVPSLINQWYVLDLRRGASLVAALVEAGLDVWCLDWGAPEDEDRYRTWDETLARLDRMVRRTLRVAGATQLGLLGYCMGGTLGRDLRRAPPGPHGGADRSGRPDRLRQGRHAADHGRSALVRRRRDRRCRQRQPRADAVRVHGPAPDPRAGQGTSAPPS
jgi:hypothetical protein